MRFKLYLALLFGLFFLQGAQAHPSFVQDKINSLLSGWLERSSTIGILVLNLDTHARVFEYHAKLPLIPASNLKILTTGCALLELGPNYRYTTKLVGREILEGHLRGDLIIRGSGDPTWSKDFYPKSITPLIIFAQRLQEEKVKVVDGDLVVDDSIFSREFVGRGWKSRYEWEEYATEVGGLSVNKNEVTVSVLPGQLGSAAQVQFYPPNHILKVMNHTWTTRSRSAIVYHRDRFLNRVVISGPLNRYGGFSFTFNIHDPPLLVGSSLYEILKEHGIRVRGKVRLIRNYEMGQVSRWQPLAEIQSRPLSVIVHRLNKESDNFLAEHLFRTLGAFHYGKGSIDWSARAVKECLATVGLTGRWFVMADGSGLSDKNRVSPDVLVAILSKLAASPFGEQFKESLPKGGVDGTLEDRLSDVTVYAKTGAIRGMISLSGYLKTYQGENLVFSIIINHFPASSETARHVIDRIVRILAQG